MEKPYVLQHKDIPVAVLMMDETGTVTDIGDKLNRRYLPVFCSDHASIRTWWSGRAIPANRQGLKADLLKCRIFTPGQLLIQNLGLSLTDCYWLRPFDQLCRWKDVNFFENSFYDSVIGIGLADSTMDLCGVSPLIPSSSLQGELRKKWIIIDGDRVLIKGNDGRGSQQSLNEVFATLLHQKQHTTFPYTSYWLAALNTLEGEALGCACKNFCDIHTEFISAYEIACSYKKRNDQSEYEAYIEYAGGHGLDIRSFMEYQIASDFILTNTDRHFNNFGLLRDADTLHYTGPAPVFDSGNSLFFKSSVRRGKDLFDIPVSSFRRREVDLLRYITSPGILDTRRLPTEEELYHLLEKDDGITEERRTQICRAYTMKIRIYLDFANGAAVWGYRYRR